MIDQDDAFDVLVEFVKAETAKAFLVVVDGEEHWIAKSQIIGEDAIAPGDEGVTLTVPRWLAEENGWA